MQNGITLAECLVAAAISGMVLAGLSAIMRSGTIASDQGRHFDLTRVQAEEVLDRIAWAMGTAEPKTQAELKAMGKPGEYTSGTWFYGKNPDGTNRIIRYDWYSNVIHEVDEAGIARGLLQGVSKFSVKQANSNDAGLVEVRLQIKSGHGEVSYSMVQRLGGTW